MGMSQVRRNAEKDPAYCPYCMRCRGLVRMVKQAAFLWACKCGAVHDERTLLEHIAMTSTQFEQLLYDDTDTALDRLFEVWLAKTLSTVGPAGAAKVLAGWTRRGLLGRPGSGIAITFPDGVDGLLRFAEEHVDEIALEALDGK